MIKQTILLVEDHYDLAITICEFLEDQGYIVDHARSLQAAQHFLGENTYHLLLLDINLPDGTVTSCATGCVSSADCPCR